MKGKDAKLSIIYILILLTILLSFNYTEVNCIIDVGNLKVGSTIRYNTSYTGTENLGFSSVTWIQFSIEYLYSNTMVVRYEDSNSFGTQRTIYPENTLRYLPFGYDSYISQLPHLRYIITPIIFSSANWTENGISWNENNALTTNTPIHNIHLKFNNIWTDAHIFSGSVQEIQYFDKYMVGTFNATYSTKNGLLLELNWDMINQISGETIIFNMILDDSNTGIGWSFIYKDIVIFSSIFGGLLGYSLIIFGIMYMRKDYEMYREVQAEGEEEEKEKEVMPVSEEIVKPAEEPIIIPKDLPEDYNFIYYCPFCNAELKEYQSVCPECGGKR